MDRWIQTSLIQLTLTAFRTLLRLIRIVLRRWLKRTISCTSTVFMLSLYDVGYFRSAASVSKALGSFARMSLATSSTTSSVDLPLLDGVLTCQFRLPRHRVITKVTSSLWIILSLWTSVGLPWYLLFVEVVHATERCNSTMSLITII